MPFVEGRRSFDTRVCYRDHSHETWSIGVVDAGGSILRCQGKNSVLRAGDVIVIAPGVVHACNPLRGRWSYRMFYFDPVWIAALMRTSDLTGIVSQRLMSTQVRARVDEITAILQRPGGGSEKVSDLARAVSQVLKAARAKARKLSARGKTEAKADKIDTLRLYLDQHYSENIVAASLTVGLGLSRFQLIRAFKQRFGLTPRAYVLDRRIRAARVLLGKRYALADVAYRVGFSDQSHFQRTFKPRVAATPAQYRTARGL